MQFRAADHQALQSMYGFKLKVDPSQPWAVPELTKEYTIEDMNIPIANKR
jgi:branched-chain amino acid transport system substrate-binding protein